MSTRIAFDNFVGPSYTSQSIQAAGERSVNLYPERIDGGGHGRNGWVLYGTPGRKRFCTLPTGPVRGMMVGDERLFVVSGSKLYEVFGDGSFARSPTASGTGEVGQPIPPYDPGQPAQIFTSPAELFVVSSGQGYLVNAAAGPNPIPVVPAATGGYLNGYFLAQLPNSNRFYISDLPAPNGLGASSWDPLDFKEKEGSADRLMRLFTDRDLLYLFGRRSTEIWQINGSGGFPFSRISGAALEQGFYAPWAIDKLDNGIFGLGGDERGVNVCWRLDGYTPRRISNHAVEWWMSRYPRKERAVSHVYQDQGHQFWQISFPDADATWVYDATTELWHERGWWDSQQFKYHQDKARHHGYVFGKHLVGSSIDGTIYEQSVEFYDDDGDPLRRLRSAPVITDKEGRIRHDYLQVDMQVGGSKTTIEAMRASGGDPQIILRCSNDGGMEWSNAIQSSLGPLGEYLYRVMFRKLGVSRLRNYEIVITDPIQVCIVNAYLGITPGNGT